MQVTAVVITIVVAALVALTYILREASLTAKVVHDAGTAMDVDDLANSTNITATLLGDRFGAADLDNSSLEASADVVSGYGSSFTGSSEPTTPEGVVSLRERPGERPSQKHHSKTVPGSGPKEEQRVRGSSLQPENEGKGLHREGEASQVHSIEHAADKTTT